MKRTIGWLLLFVIWSGVGLRIVFPADLHGSYTGIMHVIIQLVDHIFLLPPWWLLALIVAPDQAPWAFWMGTIAYLAALHLLIFVFLLRKPRNGP